MKHTTSKTDRFKKNIFPGILIVLGILFYTVYCSQLKREYGLVYIQLAPFQTGTGWGYEILANGKTYIRQSFIPAVAGEKNFKTKEDAIAVGNKVIQKMKMGEQLPTISFDELKQLGIIKDSLH
ncbi:MAG: DUF4907 domain-containing protein [Bacteroidetes bacterium]|nr:DUF4907 domain-containing protein [Bacteroidota bacterium]MBS1974304.1 DUF4907 domain-containing protein [Bacteroidota bacterium]